MTPESEVLDMLELSTAPVERHLFYNGEVELFYNDELHAYYRIIDGQKVLVAGVTTVTGMVDKSGPLMWWSVGEGIEHLINHSSNPELLRTAYYAAKNKTKLSPEEGGEESVVLSVGSINEVAGRLNDARCAHNRIAREAADIGTSVHTWLEGLLVTAIQLKSKITKVVADGYALVAEPIEGEKQRQCAALAVDWMIQHELEPIMSEAKVMSREYNYSGTLDWVAYITKNGRRYKTLGDFKTSKSLHDEYKMQVAAYYQALVEERFEEHIDIESCTILRLGKDDGVFEAVEIPVEEVAEVHLYGFLGALQTYAWFKQIDLIKRANKPKKVKKTATKKSKIVIPEQPVAEIPFG